MSFCFVLSLVTARLESPARGEVISVDYVVMDVVTDVVCGGGRHAGRGFARVGASAALDGWGQAVDPRRGGREWLQGNRLKVRGGSA